MDEQISRVELVDLENGVWVWRDVVTLERGRCRIDVPGLVLEDEVVLRLRRVPGGWKALAVIEAPEHVASAAARHHDVERWEPPQRSPLRAGDVVRTWVDIDPRSSAARDCGRTGKTRPAVVLWVDLTAGQVAVRLIWGTNSRARRDGVGRRLRRWREAGLRKPSVVERLVIIRAISDISRPIGRLAPEDAIWAIDHDDAATARPEVPA